MRLECTSLLPCTPARLAPQLARPMLLNWVSWPMLHFVAISPPELPDRFTARRYVTRLLLGGRLSIGEHTLDLQLVPGGSGGVPPALDTASGTGAGQVWHDAGHSRLVKVWDHKITLEDFRGMTRYTDVVEVHAGPLTPVAFLFAKAFYAHRQRRLRRLVASGFDYAP